MSEAELTRIQGDLAVIQRAMGLQLFFGKRMLIFGIFLTVAAVGAAVVSLLGENDWLQLAPFVAILVLGPVGVVPALSPHRQPRPRSHLADRPVGQRLRSVWVAACGYCWRPSSAPLWELLEPSASMPSASAPSSLFADLGSHGPEKPGTVLLSGPCSLHLARRDAAADPRPAL